MSARDVLALDHSPHALSRQSRGGKVKEEVQSSFWEREQVARIEYADRSNRRRHQRIMQKVLALVEPGDAAVLNIGIGNGGLEMQLMEAGYRTFSLDPSERAVRMLNGKLNAPAGRFQVGSCRAIPLPDQSMDVIVMSEVIEHLDDPTLAAAMEEINRVLKPRSYLIGTCPDNEDVAGKTLTCPHCEERFHRVGHVRSFTRRTLRSHLSTYFDVLECYSFRGMHLNWKGTALYWYQSLPYRIAGLIKPSVTVPQSLGQHLFFCARRRTSQVTHDD